MSAGCWRGRWRKVVRDYNDDGWREYDDAVPVVATTLELLAEHGPLGPVWWRFGRSGRHSLIEALENPNNRAAYDLRQAAREDEEHKAHRELMDSLVCIDCGDVPEEESFWEYGPDGRQVEWTRRPGCAAGPATRNTRSAWNGRPKNSWRPPARRTPRCARVGRAGARSGGRRVRSWSCGRRPARTGWSALSVYGPAP
ncbi:hypothetical protein F7Q99_31160 [Streptomyces kaniharaensis]|uniref:Uncharacterized protein n=1 Tax=Streptomyces kaniharaensis TaxID=212423 RepID=A0A6N7KYF2_9ACTN|nr:hypothetical protein [Streptomyces kaniharaensis]MQS16531.1 hypothetical protein [Streptomyces kaniharaensis]